MLMVLAPPAARAPPIMVASTRPSPGQPFAAITMAKKAVISSSRMMRGLVRAT
jgi:hypothetical protein